MALGAYGCDPGCVVMHGAIQQNRYHTALLGSRCIHIDIIADATREDDADGKKIFSACVGKTDELKEGNALQRRG